MDEKKSETPRVEKVPPAVAIGAGSPPISARGSGGQLTQDKDHNNNNKKKKKVKGKKGDKGKDSAPPPVTLGNVFGRPLDEVLKYQANGSPVPNVVADAIRWLEQNNGNLHRE